MRKYVFVIASFAYCLLVATFLAKADPGVTNTYKVFMHSALLFDEKAKAAIVQYEECESVNAKSCDMPIVYTGYVVRITITETSCKIRKGTASETDCDNASYFLSNLDADIDDDAKGRKGGCDSAFTAGYGT